MEECPTNTTLPPPITTPAPITTAPPITWECEEFGHFMCQTNQPDEFCIVGHLTCDGTEQCPDGIDESHSLK